MLSEIIRSWDAPYVRFRLVADLLDVGRHVFFGPRANISDSMNNVRC